MQLPAMRVSDLTIEPEPELNEGQAVNGTEIVSTSTMHLESLLLWALDSWTSGIEKPS